MKKGAKEITKNKVLNVNDKLKQINKAVSSSVKSMFKK